MDSFAIKIETLKNALVVSDAAVELFEKAKQLLSTHFSSLDEALLMHLLMSFERILEGNQLQDDVTTIESECKQDDYYGDATKLVEQLTSIIPYSVGIAECSYYMVHVLNHYHRKENKT